MGVNSLRRDCDLNPGRSAPESSTLITRLPSHPHCTYPNTNQGVDVCDFGGGVGVGTHVCGDDKLNGGCTEGYCPGQ